MKARMKGVASTGILADDPGDLNFHRPVATAGLRWQTGIEERQVENGAVVRWIRRCRLARADTDYLRTHGHRVHLRLYQGP